MNLAKCNTSEPGTHWGWDVEVKLELDIAERWNAYLTSVKRVLKMTEAHLLLFFPTALLWNSQTELRKKHRKDGYVLKNLEELSRRNLKDE
jgi:hypothetical protein